MTELHEQHCQPCRGGVPPLEAAALRDLAARLPDWEVVEEHHLARDFSFDDFVSALAFVNRVGELAEAEGHHPDIHLAWGRVRVEIWTHKIDGLTESDFVWAARCGRLHP